MKQRFNSLDVAAMSRELDASLTGMRLQNIYDLSSRIFLFKFRTPERKEQLIVETGFRCHLTSFERTTASEPSFFVQKLRKILGTKRVTKISQVGIDRNIEIQLADGLVRLYLEFFAAGNIVVTDDKYKILLLFRIVEDGTDNLHLRVGEPYNIHTFRMVEDTSLQRLKSGLESSIDKDESVEGQTKANKKKKKAQDLPRVLGLIFREYPITLIEHVLKDDNFDTNHTVERILARDDLLDSLAQSLAHISTYRLSILEKTSIPSTISAKLSEVANDGRLLYQEYEAFKPTQNVDNSECKILEYESFNKAADDFYSSIEGQRLDHKLVEKENAAKKKLEETKQQHADRLGSLQQVQQSNVRLAEAIEADVERVKEAIDAVNVLIAQSMDWADIGSLIQAEQKRGNPVAQIIKLPLKLHENTISLSLSPPPVIEDDGALDTSDTSASEDDNSDGDLSKSHSSPPASNKVVVDIDLSLSPWANASQYYDEKKTAVEKEKRTAQVSDKVLKIAEKKLAQDLKKGLEKEKDILRPSRRQFWFEKFYYFISTDGYLILAAKDDLQADILYKRTLKKGDVFVHAEIEGSTVVIIKNKDQLSDAPIPPTTLSQAGTFSICSSKSWESKALMAPWWVPSHQVTKLTPQGDYLPAGKFYINGEKTFLPPIQLLVGVGIAFLITKESKVNHSKLQLQDAEPEDSAEKLASKTAQEGTDANGLATQADDRHSDGSDEFPDVAAANATDSDEDFPDVNPLKVDDSDDEESEQLAENQVPHTQRSAPTQKSDSESEEEENNSTSLNASQSQHQRRYVTAKQRRDMKKGQKPGALNHDSQPQVDRSSDTESLSTSITTNKYSTGTPLARGARSKHKKAAVKHAHQNEEDRAAALARVEAQTGNKRKEAAAIERRAKEEAEQIARQRRRELHLRAQAQGKAAELARQAAFASSSSLSTADPTSTTSGLVPNPAAGQINGDGNEEDDEAIRHDLQAITRLVGQPQPNDTLLAALPICAPWSALYRYKYKIKAQPGSLKRGKAAREILARWQTHVKVPRNVDQTGVDKEKVWPKEAELIAGLREAEVVGVVAVRGMKIVGAVAGGGGGKDGRGKGKGGSRGGKGSKRK